MYYTKDEKNAYFYLTPEEKALKEKIGEKKWIEMLQKACQLTNCKLNLIDDKTGQEITIDQVKD